MKVGSKVICIDDSNWAADAQMVFDKLPVKGRCYIVRRIIPDFTKANGAHGIALHGIYGKWDFWKNIHGQEVFEEAHFRMKRFREVDDGEIDQLLEETLTEQGVLV